MIALAIEQDEKIQADEKRINYFREKSKMYQKKFVQLNKNWRKNNFSLLKQHKELVSIAKKMLK